MPYLFKTNQHLRAHYLAQRILRGATPVAFPLVQICDPRYVNEITLDPTFSIS